MNNQPAIPNMNQPAKSNRGVWIALGIVVLLCFCASLTTIGVFVWLGKTVKDNVQTDPEKAAQAAHQIADYDLPPGYHEQMSMDVFTYLFVILAPQDIQEGPIIMLAQFKSIGTYDQKQMEEQMRRSLEQQSGQRGADLKVIKEETVSIRGQDVTVTTREGTDQNGNSIRQVTAVFQGKNGLAMLFIQGKPDHWDEDAIDKFIKSIR